MRRQRNEINEKEETSGVNQSDFEIYYVAAAIHCGIDDERDTKDQ